jgi:cytochrome P450
MSVEQVDLVYDPYSFEIDKNPYPYFKRLRDEAPLYYNEQYNFYALSRYADVNEASRDWETYSSSRGTILELIDMDPAFLPKMIIFMDPPQHDRMRKLLSRGFAPGQMAKLEGRIRQLVCEILDAYQPGDSFDLVQDFAAPMASIVIGELAGIPAEDRAIVRQWNETALQVKEGDAAAHVFKNRKAGVRDVGAMNIQDYLKQLIASRRAAPQDDMISAIIHAKIEEDDGDMRPLDDQEILDFVGLLAGAGIETVSRFMGWAGYYLPEHPEQLEELVKDAALIPAAIEELLRYEAPSPVQGRVLMKTVTLYGKTLEPGTKILLLTAAACRDERQYKNPDALDIHRNAKHVAFGQGVHFCLGAALARLQARVALEELLKRFPTWKVDKNKVEQVHTSTVRGYRRLPITV